MKLPNGPMLFGGEFATRPPQVKLGATWTRSPSQSDVPDRAITS
jgi:hypothetical protein